VESGGVGGALIGKETGTSQLHRETLATIRGFGDQLLEVISRDACDGLNVSRVRRATQQCRIYESLSHELGQGMPDF